MLFKLRTKLFLIVLLVTLVSDSALQLFPLPKASVNNKEYEDYGKSREEWFALMHKSAPNKNWHKIEFQNKNTNTLKLKSESDSVPSILRGSWKEIGSNNQSGRVVFADYNTQTNLIYCASAGGNIWLTSLDTINWICLNDNFKIPNIIYNHNIIKNDTATLIVVSEACGIQGVFYSKDTGNTWHNTSGLDNIEKWGKIIKAGHTKNNDIFILATEWDYDLGQIISVYKSFDLGKTFNKTRSYQCDTYGLPEKFDIWCSSQNNAAFININGKIISFDNNQIIDGQLKSSTIFQGKIYTTAHISKTDTLFYLADFYNAQTDIYKSSDFGQNWNYLSSTNEKPFSNNSVHCSKTNPELISIGGIQIYASYNGGVKFALLNKWEDYYHAPSNNLHADIPAINSYLNNSENEIYFICTDGGLYVSDDSLKSVKNISLSGHNISQYYSSYTSRVNLNFIHAGSQDQGYQICKTQNNLPESFEQVISGDYGHISSSDYGKSIWMIYPGFAMYYPDIINSEKYILWHFEMNGQLWLPPIIADPENPTKAFIGGGSITQGTKLIHLSVKGNAISAEEINIDFSNSGNDKISALACSGINSDVRYVLTSEGNFFKSTNAGESWIKTEDFLGPKPHYFYGASILPSKKDINKVYIAGSGYSNSGIYISYNQGESFESIQYNLPPTLIYDLDCDTEEKYIFAATESGPFAFSIEQEQWDNIGNSIAPDQTYWSVDFIENVNIVRFATYGRGIWDYALTPDNSIIELCKKESLFIFPNPNKGNFNITTDIGHSWPKTIEIYTISGKLVFQQTIAYSPSNIIKIQASHLNSGIYVVRLGNPEFVETSRFIIQ